MKDKAYKEERRNARERKTKIYTFIGFTVALALVMTVFFTFVLPKTEKMHYHVWLSIAVNGQEMEIPKDTGIDTNPDYFKWHGLDEYSSKAGHSPIHTHNVGGPFHIESTVVRNYTLGELLQVAGWDFDNAQNIELKRIEHFNTDSEREVALAGKDSYKEHVFEDMERLVLIVEQ